MSYLESSNTIQFTSGPEGATVTWSPNGPGSPLSVPMDSAVAFTNAADSTVTFTFVVNSTNWPALTTTFVGTAATIFTLQSSPGWSSPSVNNFVLNTKEVAGIVSFSASSQGGLVIVGTIDMTVQEEGDA